MKIELGIIIPRNIEIGPESTDVGVARFISPSAIMYMEVQSKVLRLSRMYIQQ